MRLLSILALLFLISFLLHGGLKDRTVPDEQAGQNTEEVEEVTEVADVTDVEPAHTEQENFSSLIFSQPYPVRHFDFEREPVFSMIELEIKNLIIGRKDDSFKEKNRLCAVGYEFPHTLQGKKKIPARKEVIVYWKEGKTLHRWRGGDPQAARRDFYNARSLLYSRSIPLDPNQGVIGEGEEAGNGFDDYKDRAENVISDCEAHGKLYEIEPFTPPPIGFGRPEAGRPRVPSALPPATTEPAATEPTPMESAPAVPAPVESIPAEPTPTAPFSSLGISGQFGRGFADGCREPQQSFECTRRDEQADGGRHRHAGAVTGARQTV
jgi:hypothetical protein